MKINFFPILTEHHDTLRNPKTKTFYKFDIIVFWLTPLSIGFLGLLQCVTIDRDSHNLIVAAFAIFAALLLNVQVGLLSILQRERPRFSPHKNSRLRNELLRQINANVSYLILFSCISVCLSLGAHILKISSIYASSIIIVIIAHFMLTLLMVVKRAFIIFQKEYETV